MSKWWDDTKKIEKLVRSVPVDTHFDNLDSCASPVWDIFIIPYSKRLYQLCNSTAHLNHVERRGISDPFTEKRRMAVEIGMCSFEDAQRNRFFAGHIATGVIILHLAVQRRLITFELLKDQIDNLKLLIEEHTLSYDV